RPITKAAPNTTSTTPSPSTNRSPGRNGTVFATNSATGETPSTFSAPNHTNTTARDTLRTAGPKRRANSRARSVAVSTAVCRTRVGCMFSLRGQRTNVANVWEGPPDLVCRGQVPGYHRECIGGEVPSAPGGTSPERVPRVLPRVVPAATGRRGAPAVPCRPATL